MSEDTAEMFAPAKPKARRKGPRDHAPHVLAAAGLPFVSKEGGSRLVIDDRFDYWPSSGLFFDRTTGARDRGITRLVAAYRKG